jgi:hypothetical protein
LRNYGRTPNAACDCICTNFRISGTPLATLLNSLGYITVEKLGASAAKAHAGGLTGSLEAALGLINRLSAGTVMPATLNEVVAELIEVNN